MLVAAVISAVRLDFGGGRAVSGSVGVTALTAVFVALIWLPGLLRVLGIAGGGVKTPAGEATTPGLGKLFDLVDPETKRETFPSLLTALISPGVLTEPSEYQESRTLRREISSQLAAVSPASTDPRHALQLLARKYEQIRRGQPPGDDRTRQMTRLTAEMRAIANVASVSSREREQMLRDGSEGERVVALAITQDRPNPVLFDSVCDAILNSRSAFEQFHALVAMLEMLTVLSGEQRVRLRTVLDTVLDDAKAGIKEDTSRASLVDAMSSWLKEP